MAVCDSVVMRVGTHQAVSLFMSAHCKPEMWEWVVIRRIGGPEACMIHSPSEAHQEWSQDQLFLFKHLKFHEENFSLHKLCLDGTSEIKIEPQQLLGDAFLQSSRESFKAQPELLDRALDENYGAFDILAKLTPKSSNLAAAVCNSVVLKVGRFEDVESFIVNASQSNPAMKDLTLVKEIHPQTDIENSNLRQLRFLGEKFGKESSATRALFGKAENLIQPAQLKRLDSLLSRCSNSKNVEERNESLEGSWESFRLLKQLIENDSSRSHLAAAVCDSVVLWVGGMQEVRLFMKEHEALMNLTMIGYINKPPPQQKTS